MYNSRFTPAPQKNTTTTMLNGDTKNAIIGCLIVVFILLWDGDFSKIYRFDLNGLYMQVYNSKKRLNT